MNIAIDVSPLESGHKVRGVGFYLTNLKKALLTHFPENKYLFFIDKKELTKDIDVIHYPYFDPFFTTLSFFEQYKRVITVHDLTPLVFPDHFPAGIRGKIAWQIQRMNLLRSDAIITDSDSSTKDVKRFTGIASKKVQSVYLAAGEGFEIIKNQESRIKNIKEKYNLPNKFVLYVGDVTWNKNVPRLLKAIKQVNIPLVLVGKSLNETNFDRTNVWNQDRIEIEYLTKDEPLFLKLGFVPDDDLVALYNAATCFVFPSLYEGFGLPVLEAMQSGCPVITTDKGSLSEVAGDAAYIVDPYKEESIGEAIKKVYDSSALQKSLIEKGLQRAKQFTWQKTAEQTIAVYKKLFQ